MFKNIVLELINLVIIAFVLVTLKTISPLPVVVPEADSYSIDLTSKIVAEPIEKQLEERVLININLATIDELVKIKGIGEKTANNIIEYRKNHGRFKTIDDLLAVKGIGERKLAAIRPYIYLDNGKNSP